MWPNFFTRFPFPFPTLGRVNYNTLPTVAVTAAGIMAEVLPVE